MERSCTDGGLSALPPQGQDQLQCCQGPCSGEGKAPGSRAHWGGCPATSVQGGCSRLLFHDFLSVNIQLCEVVFFF